MVHKRANFCKEAKLCLALISPWEKLEPTDYWETGPPVIAAMPIVFGKRDGVTLCGEA